MRLTSLRGRHRGDDTKLRAPLRGALRIAGEAVALTESGEKQSVEVAEKVIGESLSDYLKRRVSVPLYEPIHRFFEGR